MQNEPHLISVIVPCYNCADFIEACIQSILEQDYQHLEIIAVDNGSTDNTKSVLRLIEDPRLILTEETVKGPAAARNKGLREAKGEWIAFNDGDDVWLPNKLKHQLQCFHDYPNILFCFGHFIFWNKNELGEFEIPDWGNQLDTMSYDNTLSGDIVNDLIFDAKIWTPTVLMKRELIDKIGYFDESLMMGEDIEYWFRAAMISDTIKINTPLALYRTNEQSITHKLHQRNYAADVFELFVDRLIKANRLDVPSHALRHHRYKLWFRFGYKNIQGGDRNLARKGFKTSLMYRPFALSAWYNLLKCYL